MNIQRNINRLLDGKPVRKIGDDGERLTNISSGAGNAHEIMRFYFANLEIAGARQLNVIFDTDHRPKITLDKRINTTHVVMNRLFNYDNYS